MSGRDQELAQAAHGILPERREADGRDPLEPDGEERDDHRGQPEVRQRQAQDGEEPAQVVARGVLLHRGEHADRAARSAGRRSSTSRPGGEVRLMRFRSSWVTGRRVISERPRSPCTRSPIQVRYWARNGRSRPSSWRARVEDLRASGAAAWSSCMMTASPGRMRTSEKISRATRATAPAARAGSGARCTSASRAATTAYCANLSNFRLGALSVSHAVLASYEQ